LAVSERTNSGDAAPLRRRPRRLLQLIVMVCVALAAILMLTVPVAAGSARFVWNVTASAPAGLYRITHEPWFRGDRVAVLPGAALGADLDRRGVLANGKLLIKRVAGRAGDRVCRHGADVSINDEPAAKARDVDSQGVQLGSWQGCVTLDDGQVFLLGDTPGSYDGRYFGVTPSAEIVGQAAIVLAF
jgi:conjugative transfer signal peptidase TraF